MTLQTIVLVAGALLLVGSRTAIALGAYVVLTLIATVAIAPSAASSPLALAIFIVTVAMKLVVAPVGLAWFVRGNRAAGDLRPALALPWRLALAIGFALAADAAGSFPAFSGLPLLPLAVYAVLCGIGTLIVYRNLIAHVIGLLALGAGVTLCGAVLAPQLPESVELGATFDAIVGTFIGLALIRAFAAENPMLDVDSLRKLRG